VFKRGRKTQDALFTVFAAAGATTRARIGLAVSRKVSHKAVVRNRIKRQVRESFRHNQFPLTGLDLVIVARPAAAASAGPRLRASLQQHWEEITRKCKKL
jgi:ribonuclease P protein component